MSWNEWRRIDDYEKKVGGERGKEREKLTDVGMALEIAKK